MKSRQFVVGLCVVFGIAAAVAAREGAPVTDQMQISMQTSTVGGSGPVQVGQALTPINQSGTGLLVGQVIDAGTGTGVSGAVVSIGSSAGGGAQRVVQDVTVQSFNLGGPGGGGNLPLVLGGGNSNLLRVLTDAEGRFVFKNLPKGSFGLNATKAGFLDGAYGRLRPSGTSQSIDLADGDRQTDVKVRIFRTATIAGTVNDDQGDPVVGVSLRAYRRTYVSGRRLLTLAATSSPTDDRGMYRLTGLVPGDYVVMMPSVQSSVPASMSSGFIPTDLLSTMMSPGNGGSVNISLGNGGVQLTPQSKFLLQTTARTSTAQPPDAAGKVLVYATQYFPQGGTASQAAPITVGSGEERNGIDLQLKLVPTANISGRVTGADSPASNWALHLVPSDTGEMSSEPDIATAVTDENGDFTFLCVPAGNYVVQTVRPGRGPAGEGQILSGANGTTMMFATRITATAGPGAPPPPPQPNSAPTLWTATPVSLTGSDVTNLGVVLRPGLTISGKIDFQGSADRPTPDRLTTVLVSVDSADGKSRAVNPSGRIDANGGFTIQGVLPGKYLVRVLNGPQGWTFKSATAGGTDLAENAFDVQDHDIANVSLVFIDQATNLAGTVKGGNGQPDGAAAVVVFPSDNRAWANYGTNPRRMRMARASKTGAYTFGQLPAGDYFLVAVSDEVAGDWQNPQFLEQISRTATRISFSEGEKKTQDLTTINIRPAGSDQPESDRTYDDAHGPFVAESSATDDDQVMQQTPPTRDTRPVTPPPPPNSPARDAAAPSTAIGGNATISGTVLLDDGSQQAARRARVTLRNIETRAERAAATDDSGRFAIASLPAGKYNLFVSKPSYITNYYGAKRPGRGTGIPVTLADGQTMTGLSLRLPRGAVISGIVKDDFAQGVPNATVRVSQLQRQNGQPTYNTVTTAQTDDRGMYRAFGLAPGSYVVSVAPPPTLGGGTDLKLLSTADLQAALNDARQAQTPTNAPSMTAPTPGSPQQPGRAVGYAQVFYPGTLVAADAGSLTLTQSQELTGIDIPMRVVRTAKVEGTVLGPDGRPMPGVQLTLLPAGMDQGLIISANSLRTNDQGKFTASQLSPGHYTLSARAGRNSGDTFFRTVNGDNMGFAVAGVAGVRASGGGGGAGPPPPPPPPPPMPMGAGPGPQLWAMTDIDVNGEDIANVSLTLAEGMTVTGKIQFAGKAAPPPDVTKVRFMLTPTAVTSGLSMGMVGAEIDATGKFTMSGVTPGKYRISSLSQGGRAGGGGAGAGVNWLVRSAIFQGQDIVDVPLEVRPGQNVDGVAVTFTDSLGELSGSLLDNAGKPAPGYMVLVFSTDRSIWSQGTRRVPAPIQPDTSGKFRADGLPAGEYYVAAVSDMDPGDWGDPGFMEQVAAVAFKITLGEGEKKTQDLKIAG